MKKILFAALAVLFSGALAAAEFDSTRTFTAQIGLGAGLRVKCYTTNGNITVAGAGEDDIGTTMSQCTASDHVGVRLAVAGRTYEMQTDAAIAVGTDVYPAADGCVSATKAGKRIGITLTASTATKLKCEVMRLPQPAGEVVVTAGGTTTISSGAGSVKMKNTGTADNAAWIPITYDGTLYYVPAWTTPAP